MNRRSVLRGIGGVSVALPFLEGFSARKAQAATPPFAVFVRQGNGVAQAVDFANEPERFWPTQLGPLTTATMAADRSVSELSAYSSKLLIVKGLTYPVAFKDTGCAHSTCGNMCLTATAGSQDPSGNKSLGMGESIDNRIARELTPGVEPLTLYAGNKAGYIDEVLSYRGPKMLRAAENNPWNAYSRLFGMADPNAVVMQQLAKQRKSVNDLIRNQMKSLQARPELSKSDKDRLDLHFSAIRDLEVGMVCQLPKTESDPIKALGTAATTDDKCIDSAKMMMEMIALAISCGLTRVATLQIGGGNDGTRYTIDGVKLPSYHQISHRIYSDGSDGAPIPDAQLLHSKVDRLMARTFKHLLDRLSAYQVGNGTLLDQGVAIWLNDMRNGMHQRENLPYVMAGSCNGALKQGVFVDVQGATNNKMFNTLGSILGCKNAAGGPLDDFGDPSLQKGSLAALRA